MKRLAISKMMDEYTDTEFFPLGESAVTPEAVKARVLPDIKAPTGEKRLSGMKKMLLIAGLAAALVVLAGAGFPSRIIQLASGTLTLEQSPDITSVSYEPNASTIEVEDGRLFFVLDEERTDITDLINEDTPYIYDGSDPETGLTYYFIMGGTLENYGWLEWVEVPNLYRAEDYEPTPVLDQDEQLISYELCAFLYNKESGGYNSFGCSGIGGGLDWAYMKDFSWLITGAKELGLPFVDSDSGTGDIFYLS